MSSGTTFDLTVEKKSMMNVVEDCLEQMKGCCKTEIPFHPATEMESAIDVVEDCLEQIQGCCELAKKVGTLESYKKRQSTTKIMLLLTKYGSEDAFVEKVNSAMSRFSGEIEDLKSYVGTVDEISLAKASECPKCKGRGEIVKFRAVRERGSQPYSVSHATRCSTCKGLGEIPMEKEVLERVALFLEKAGKLLETMEEFHKSLNSYTETSFKRMEAIGKGELKSARGLIFEPVERKETRIEVTQLQAKEEPKEKETFQTDLIFEPVERKETRIEVTQLQAKEEPWEKMWGLARENAQILYKIWPKEPVSVTTKEPKEEREKEIIYLEPKPPALTRGRSAFWVLGRLIWTYVKTASLFLLLNGGIWFGWYYYIYQVNGRSAGIALLDDRIFGLSYLVATFLVVPLIFIIRRAVLIAHATEH